MKKFVDYMTSVLKRFRIILNRNHNYITDGWLFKKYLISVNNDIKLGDYARKAFDAECNMCCKRINGDAECNKMTFSEGVLHIDRTLKWVHSERFDELSMNIHNVSLRMRRS